MASSTGPKGPTSNERSEHGRFEPSSLTNRLDEALVQLDRVRDRPLLSAALALTLCLVVVAGWGLGRSGSAPPVEAGIPLATPVPVSSSTTLAGGNEVLLVHVAGAVVNPGIVELGPDARIVDAVNAAGGPLSAADVHQLNLAAPVVDGMQIRVPLVGEEVENPSGAVGPIVDGGPKVVNINRASAGELEQLPGIGPALGAAIVEWREANGSFLTVDDLLSVPGIGPAKLAALADLAST